MPARDFAKFGRLYLHKGNWNGQQLLPAQWIEESTQAIKTEGGVSYYKYQWWITKDGYVANGLHGQYIYVNPAKNVIMVRLGKSDGKLHWESMFDKLATFL